MGDYSEEQRAIRYYKEHKEDYELKTIGIKRYCGIPFFWIKKSKYEKGYFLFNVIPIFSEVNYGGFYD